MADASSEKKSLITLSHEVMGKNYINEVDRRTAHKYGITQEGLEATHPEVGQAYHEFGRKLDGVGNKVAWITGLSTAAGVAVPLALKRPKNLGARAATAVVTGAIAAAVGFVTTALMSRRQIYSISSEVINAENKALEQDIEAAMARENPASQSPPKQFTAALEPRADSHAGQVAKGAADSTQTLLRV